MSRHKFAVLVWAVVLGLIVSACTPAATPTQAPAAAPTQAPAEKPTEPPAAKPTDPPAAPPAAEPAMTEVKAKDPNTFVFQTFGDPETLDPHVDYESAGGGLLQNIYENLITFDGKDPTSFVPLLAESIPEPKATDDGGLEYVWTIRDGVKFSDGTPLTAEDVAYSFWRSMLVGDPNAPSFLLTQAFLNVDDATQLVDPEGALVGDPETLKSSDAAKLVAACETVKSAVTFDNASRTVTMKLVHPWGPFLATLAGGPWAAIVSKQWVAAQGDWDADCATWQNFYGIPSESGIIRDKTMGTGPYILDSWVPQEEIVLTANPNYWREPAKIGRVVIKNVTEFGTRFAALQAGDADNITLGSKADEVQMDTLVRDKCDPETNQCETINPDGILRVYKGMASTNRTDVLFVFEVAEGSTFVGSGVLDGSGVPLNFFSDVHIRRAFNYCFDIDTYIQDVLLGDGFKSKALTLPGQPGYDESPVYEFDLAKCEEEFKASTLTAEDGTPLWDIGFYLQLGYNAGNTARQSIAEILAANIGTVNPNFFIAPVALPWPTFLRTQRAKQFPIVTVGWNEDLHDPHNWYVPYLTGTYADRQNLPQEMIDKYAVLINEGVKETDPAKRGEIYAQLNTQVYEDAAHIILAVATRTRYEPLYLKGWYGGQNHNPLVNNFYYYDFSKE